MLNVAELWMDGVNQTLNFFKHGLYLDFELKNYIMDSLDGKFIFIPEEGGGVLIEMNNLKKIKKLFWVGLNMKVLKVNHIMKFIQC